MKRILILALLIISACHNTDPKQEQAESLAKAYMNQHLSKYEGLTFSKLIGLHTHYNQTKDGISLNQKIKLEKDSVAKLDSEESILDKNTKSNWDKIKAFRKKNLSLSDTMVKNMTKMVDLITTFKGKLQGYKLYYTYKIQDKFEPVYHKMTFKIDTPILHITSVKDTIIKESDVSWK